MVIAYYLTWQQNNLRRVVCYFICKKICCNSNFVFFFMLYILDNDVFPCLSFFLVNIWSNCQQSHLNYLTFFHLLVKIYVFTLIHFLWCFLYCFFIIHFACNHTWCGYLAIQFTGHCHINNVFLDFCTCLLTWMTSNPFPICKKFPSIAILYTLHLIQSFYPVAHFNPYSLPQPLISSLEPCQILLKIWLYYIHWIPLISYSSNIFKELQQAR